MTSHRTFTTDGSGSSAVEFALVLPILLMLCAAIIGYGYVLGIYHGVQQIASEAARAAVGGLSDAERDRLARAFVTAHSGGYSFLDPAKLSVSTLASGEPSPAFQVSVVYDFSESFVHRVGALVSLPHPLIARSAVIQRGGY